jgi:dual oxidase maturation factor 1
MFFRSAFVLWVAMNMMMLVVPRYGAYLMSLTGVMMMFCNAIYYWLLPRRPLLIHIEDVVLKFELGWCFWLILIAGKFKLKSSKLKSSKLK